MPRHDGSWMEDVDKEASVMAVPEERRDIYGKRLQSKAEMRSYRAEKQKVWKQPSK